MKRKTFFPLVLMICNLLFAMPCFSAEQLNLDLKPVMDQYTIRMYDVLEISVWGVDGLTRTVKVRPDGKISFPLIGDLYVLGKTPGQIAAAMDTGLEKYVVQAKVSIIVNEFYKPQVYILGEIQNSGAYDLTEPKMLMKLLAQAKLIHPQFQNHTVTIISDGKEQIVSLGGSKSDALSADSFSLNDGDVIYVSYQETPKVYVLGDLASSGEYPIPENRSNVYRVLSQAKALNKSIIHDGITLIRGHETTSLSLTNLPKDFEIQPDDVLLIEAKPEFVTIAGSAANPGLYHFVPGQALVDYIYQAGGPSGSGNLKNVRIYRNYPDKTEIIQVKNLFDAATPPPPVASGDVIQIQKRKTNRFFSEILPLFRDVAIFVKVLSD